MKITNSWRKHLRRLGWSVASVVMFLFVTRPLAQFWVSGQSRIEEPSGIDLDEQFTLGGIPQWVRVRGRDANKPPLLWIHGGPGFPQMPFADATRSLERDFVVIQWDQRGAGRTFRSSPDAPLRFEWYVRDAEELLRAVLARLHQPKCILVGHSWGSLVGAVLAKRCPELVRCYIGVGQVVSFRRSEQDRFDRSVLAARAQHDEAGRSALRRVGPPPHKDMADCKVIDQWFARLVPPTQTGPSPMRFVALAFACPDYGWLDLLALVRGVRHSTDELWREIYYDIDLARMVPRLEVPVDLLCGEYDRVAPIAVAESWLRTLQAPDGARLHRFRASTHWTFLEEPDRFCELVAAVAHSELLAKGRGKGPR